MFPPVDSVFNLTIGKLTNSITARFRVEMEEFGQRTTCSDHGGGRTREFDDITQIVEILNVSLGKCRREFFASHPKRPFPIAQIVGSEGPNEVS